MVLNERQQKLLEVLLTQQSASVAELSKLFDVSAVTIRSDLAQLEQQGRVVRTRGGARISDGRIRQELTFATRQQINADPKQRIGELAATLVEPMEAVLLDASTTSVAVGQALKRAQSLGQITVVTTGVFTALELLDSPHIHVVLAGGYIRTVTGSIAGSITKQVLQNFNFSKAFLGGWGISLEEGLTDTHLTEVDLKQTIIERAKEVIAVMDGSKFGRAGLASFAPLERVDRVITDESAPQAMVEALRERGIEVLIAARAEDL